MVRDRELLSFRPDRRQLLPNLYALPGTRKARNDHFLYGHEMDCADVFVALWNRCNTKLVRWQRAWEPEEHDYFAKRFGVKPDRVFELEDSTQVFFLEVDRGSEDPMKQIWPKLEGYVKLSRARPDQRFTVLFTAQGYRYHGSDLDRLSELLPVLARAKRGNQFLVGVHEEFLADPLSDCFISPLDPSRKLSLLAL